MGVEIKPTADHPVMLVTNRRAVLMSVPELLDENEGFETFVVGVLAGLARDLEVDDSDIDFHCAFVTSEELAPALGVIAEAIGKLDLAGAFQKEA